MDLLLPSVICSSHLIIITMKDKTCSICKGTRKFTSHGLEDHNRSKHPVVTITKAIKKFDVKPVVFK